MRNERNGEINRKWIENAVGKYDKLYILLCKIICIKYKYKYILTMASEASPLENDLVAVVETHPEIFSPQDIVNMRRKIIFTFGMVAAPKGVSTQYTEVIGLSGIATAILIHVSNDVNKKIINTSRDVHDVLHQFEFCVEFINKFLTKLCHNERSWHFGSGSNSSPTPKMYCETMSQCVIPHSSQHYTGHGVPNIFELVKKKINEYQSRILGLWADVLIREEKIKTKEVTEMETSVNSAPDGYEGIMRQLFEECGGYSTKQNLDDSMLFKWLTLFHVAIKKDVHLRELTKTYDNLGSLDRIIYGIMSQFVSSRNVQSSSHESKLNVLHLTCNVIEKNAGQQPPVYAYLSSDILDQYVERVERFPSTDEFLSTRMIEKATAAAAFSSQPPPPSAPPPSAPPLSLFDGGKKTRRKKNKKLKNVKKSKKSRRRFIKTHHHR